LYIYLYKALALFQHVTIFSMEVLFLKDVMAKGNDSIRFFSPWSTSWIYPCLWRAANHCKRL